MRPALTCFVSVFDRLAFIHCHRQSFQGRHVALPDLEQSNTLRKGRASKRKDGWRGGWGGCTRMRLRFEPCCVQLLSYFTPILHTVYALSLNLPELRLSNYSLRKTINAEQRCCAHLPEVSQQEAGGQPRRQLLHDHLRRQLYRGWTSHLTPRHQGFR